MSPPVEVITITPEQLRQIIREELDRLRPESAAATEDDLVTERQACERLGVSRRTVQRMVARGEIPSIKCGRARRLQISGLLRRAS